MTAKEYLEIFQAEGLIRSELVRLMEEGVAFFQKCQKEAEDPAKKKKFYDMAEIAKWQAIELAEWEKVHGFIDLSFTAELKRLGLYEEESQLNAN